MMYFSRQCRLITLALFLALFSTPLFAAEAPAFDLPTATKNISLNQLNGKVVYLDFWASWCSPCRKSFPWMRALQTKYQDEGLVVVAVNLDQDKDKAEEFLKEFPNNLTIAFDPEGSVAEKYKVRGMPSSYLIDRNGQLYFSHIGFRQADADELESKIRTLLKQ
jgi:cytochrome c biogenesis protein CcmG/thiol:disulfide interchange protein DsbE